MQSCDVIKSGCDVTWNSYDVIHIVGVISHILRMFYSQYIVNDSSAPVEAMRCRLGVMT